MFSISQKNTLLSLIKESGINAREFNLTTSSDPLELRLTYKPEKFYFRITHVKIGLDQNRQDVMRLATFSTPKPGLIFDTKNEYQHNGIDRWEAILAVVSQWLTLLKAEFRQPDLWAELEHSPDFFAEHETLPEDAFTPDEITLLAARVIHVEQQIVELNLPNEAEAAITKAVREVPEKAKRLTKKEMGEIVLSSVLREGFKAMLTKENMLAVLHLIMSLFTLAIGQ